MSKVYADAVTSTEANQDLTFGGSGDNVIVTSGATLKTNTIKDSGGNTLWTSDGSGNLSSVNSGLKGNMILLSTQTVSNLASVSFTSNIDSTYKLYIFKFIDINPATDTVTFGFRGSSNTGVAYGVSKTTSAFAAYKYESGSGGVRAYEGGHDLANQTSVQKLSGELGNDADQSCAGELYLFNPSSTTYVKHFYATVNIAGNTDYTQNWFFGGYFNTTSVIDAMQFTVSSGNFDGTIEMFGVG